VRILASPAASQVVPGVLGFLVVAAMGVALFFLLRSMNKHLRKVALSPAGARKRAARKAWTAGTAGTAGMAGMARRTSRRLITAATVLVRPDLAFQA